MREMNDSRHEQFVISPETTEQELRSVDCEWRQTIIVKTMREREREIKTTAMIPETHQDVLNTSIVPLICRMAAPTFESVYLSVSASVLPM